MFFSDLFGITVEGTVVVWSRRVPDYFYLNTNKFPWQTRKTTGSTAPEQFPDSRNGHAHFLDVTEEMRNRPFGYAA